MKRNYMNALVTVPNIDLTRSKPFVRAFLVFVAIACALGFSIDDKFPLLLGFLLLAMTILGCELFWQVRRPVWTLYVIHALFVLTFPLYLAHLVFDQDLTFMGGFPFDERSYGDVILYSVSGYGGVLLAQVMLIFAPRGGAPASFSVQNYVSNVRTRDLMLLSILLFLLSAVVTYKTGVGVTGYSARPSVDYVYGFVTRLGRTVVPLLNLFLVEKLLREKDSKAARMFVLIVAVEVLVGVTVTLSRATILNYVLLPLVFAWLYRIQETTRRSWLQITRRLLLLGLLMCSVIILITLTAILRDVIFLRLATGHGYAGIFMIDNLAAVDWTAMGLLWDSVNLKAFLSMFTFYERFTGVRELMWVYMVGPSGEFNAQNLLYTVIMGPPAEDPYFITNLVLGVNENVNEDTGFGTALSLMANLLLSGAHGTLFVGMAGITLSLVFLESVVRSIVRYDSVTFYFVVTVLLSLWAGDAFTTTFQRPVQMIAVGVGLLVLLGMKARKRERDGSLGVKLIDAR